MSCQNPYPFLDIILEVTSNISVFVCKVCNVSASTPNFIDKRTNDVFVICPACIRIWRTCDWLEINSNRVGNWTQSMDALGPYVYGLRTDKI